MVINVFCLNFSSIDYQNGLSFPEIFQEPPNQGNGRKYNDGEKSDYIYNSQYQEEQLHRARQLNNNSRCLMQKVHTMQ